jgi:hypothetical protein
VNGEKARSARQEIAKGNRGQFIFGLRIVEAYQRRATF